MHTAGQVTLIESGPRRCPNNNNTTTTTYTTNNGSTTTMIVNLGGHPDATHHHTNHNTLQHHNQHPAAMLHQQPPNSMSPSHGQDVLTLLAPISTVTSANGVLLASSAEHSIYQHSQQNAHPLDQHHSMQLSHKNHSHSHQPPQLVQHLNSSGMIITTTTLPALDANTVHHQLSNDIELFQLPPTNSHLNHCNGIKTTGVPNGGGASARHSSASTASSPGSNSLHSAHESIILGDQVYTTAPVTRPPGATTTATKSSLMSPLSLKGIESVVVGIQDMEVEHEHGLDDDTVTDLHLLKMADHSYSSHGSLEIDLDAHLDDDDSSGGAGGGGYADASPTNGVGLQQSGGHQTGGTSVGSHNNNNNVASAYLPLLPPIVGGGGGSVGSVGTGSTGGGSHSGTGTSASSGNGNGSCDQTELKDCIEELCPVCGDKVSGYHYGLLTCESCKGFFKRTVQNKKVYTCVAERQCHIDKTQRKRCPFCRFQKCLEVGMKLEAVRADRMRGGRNKFGPMYKRDRARKLQIMRQRQLAIQTLRASSDGGSGLSPTGYPSSYHMSIKQEIQIPQISSLTSSSPDSSPSPIAIALGQVSASGVPTALTLGIGGGGGGGGGGSGPSGNQSNSNNNNNNSNGSTNSIPSTTTTSSAVHNTQPTDSKLWFANSTTASPHSLSPKQFSFDSGSNPTSTADAGPVESHSKKQNWKNTKSLNFPRVSPMIREFVQSVDDREWQQQLFSLLQSQSYNQCEVDVFELMCKVLDQNLFSQVDWARNTVFFKDLKVDDQMKLLQNSWSDMLVLDHLHQRIHNSLPDETTLHNGQKFDLLGLGLLGVPQLSDHFNELQHKLVELKFDVGDYICMKFLQLLNPDFEDVRGITNKKTVLEGYENVQAALLDYTLTCYPSVTEKFSKLISIIPEIHAMAARGEEHLYVKHCAGSAPTQTLLMEMLHAKRK